MEKLEERMAKVEGILEEIRARLNHVESWQRWTLGIMVTMWITIILTIFFKG